MVITTTQSLEERSESVPITSVDVNLIDKSPYQPRKKFDITQLSELAQSIERYTLLTPILVRKAGNRYELVAGERRLRAVRDLLGWDTIDARIIQCTDQESAEVGAEENGKRVDLLPSEKANQALILYETGSTHERIAAVMGCSVATAAKWVRVGQMDEAVVELLDNRELKHDLLPIIDSLLHKPDQKFAATIAAAGSLSIPELQARVNHLPRKPPSPQQSRMQSAKPRQTHANPTSQQSSRLSYPGDLEDALLKLRAAIDDFEEGDSLGPETKATLTKLVDGTVKRLIELRDSLV